MKYVDLDEIYAQSHIISLHCPLMKETYHMIDQVLLYYRHPYSFPPIPLLLLPQRFLLPLPSIKKHDVE